VTVIGFVGADPEQRQARNNNGSKFTVLSVATQRSWKNTDDEWVSKTEWHRVCVIWNQLFKQAHLLQDRKNSSALVNMKRTRNFEH
jgi:single-stranded DNA-binding protein